MSVSNWVGAFVRIAYNEFYGISECRIHQSTEGLAQFRGQLLGRKTEERGKRDDGDKVEDKGDGRVPVPCASDYAQRYKHKQNVYIVAGQCRIS